MMRTRGFSLVELLVGVAVSMLVVAAATVLLIATQRSFTSGVADRAVQETARIALGEIGSRLRAAGYGLEPTFAFDFGQAITIQDRLPTGSQPRFGGYQCANLVTCRDRTDGPDEVVFYARDPKFGMDLSGGIGAASITLAGPLKTPILGGQVLQVMCYGTANEWLWAYVTVDADVPAAPTAGVVAVPLRAAPNGALALDFPYQNSLLQRPCFGSGLRRAFKIDRYRYYVAAVDDAGTVRPWETAGTRPYLMLDQGLSTGPVAIAPDVEDLQAAYVFPLADPAARVVGADVGTAVTNDATDTTGIDMAPGLGIPSFATPSLDPLRTTHHPANIRAVRVALTVRTDRVDPSIPDATVPRALNRAATGGEAGYRRAVFETTTYTRNLENRLPVFPIYDPSATSASCAGTAGNCGGG